MDGALSNTTTPNQSEPRNNDNEGVVHITQSSRIEATSLDCLVFYPGHSLGGILPFCRETAQCILQLQVTGLDEFV